MNEEEQKAEQERQVQFEADVAQRNEEKRAANIKKQKERAAEKDALAAKLEEAKRLKQ